MPVRVRAIHRSYTGGDPHRVERVLSHLWERARQALWAPEEEWHPLADVYETPLEVGVLLDVAGTTEDDIQLTFYQDILLVEGIRHLAAPREDGVIFHEAQIPYGRFSLDVLLPAPVVPEKVHVTMDRGIMHITLPKRRTVGSRGPQQREVGTGRGRGVEDKPGSATPPAPGSMDSPRGRRG